MGSVEINADNATAKAFEEESFFPAAAPCRWTRVRCQGGKKNLADFRILIFIFSRGEWFTIP